MKRHIAAMGLMITLLAASIFVVQAACDVATAGPDTINCTGVSGTVDGLAGNDVIRVDGTLTGNVIGSEGADTITIDGVLNGFLYGDVIGANGTANDTIIINGTVNGAVIGDSGTSTIAAGNDTIIVNGEVTGNIIADSTVNSTIIPGGDDTVILRDGANGGPDNSLTLIGVIGFDRLRIEFTMNSEADYLAMSALIAAANPNLGSLTFNGQTFNFFEFDTIENALIQNYGGSPPVTLPEAGTGTTAPDDRLNWQYGDDYAVAYVRQSDNGSYTLQIYCVNSDSKGWIAAVITQADFNKAAIPLAQNAVIKEVQCRVPVGVYALTTGEYQLNIGPNESGTVLSVIWRGLSPTDIYRTYYDG